MKMMHRLLPNEPEHEGWFNDAATYALQAEAATTPEERKRLLALSEQARALGEAAQRKQQ